MSTSLFNIRIWKSRNSGVSFAGMGSPLKVPSTREMRTDRSRSRIAMTLSFTYAMGSSRLNSGLIGDGPVRVSTKPDSAAGAPNGLVAWVTTGSSPVR